LFFEYLDMENLIEPVVVRLRPKAEDGSRSNELGALEVDSSSNGDNSEKVPNVEPKGGRTVQAVLVPVKRQDHLGLISTTLAQVISYTTSNFSY
jgi:hypothetical protein